MTDYILGDTTTGWPVGAKTRLKDMGDGTHAIVMSTEGSTVSLTDDTTVKTQGELIEGTATTFRIDRLNNGLVTVADALYSTHRGTRFIASYLVPHGSELANDVALDLMFITGNIVPRIVFSVIVGGHSEVSLYENPTITGNGTNIIARNKNRRSTNTATSTVYHTPTVGALGSSLLYARFVPGGTGVALVGGAAQETEWMFNTGTTYLFRLINRSGAAILGSMTIEWDENA